MADPHHAFRRPDDLSTGRPPWDIGAPQPTFAALAQDGALRGRVLDVGCGTGEHTLMAAARGLDTTGIDLADGALRTAGQKAQERGLTARFLLLNALQVADLGELFDTALDSLVMHAFNTADRATYLEGLHAVLRPGGRLFVLCYSDLHTAEPDVPHKISREELESVFADGWAVESIQSTVSRSNVHVDGVAAWLATCTRL